MTKLKGSLGYNKTIGQWRPIGIYQLYSTLTNLIRGRFSEPSANKAFGITAVASKKMLTNYLGALLVTQELTQSSMCP